MLFSEDIWEKWIAKIKDPFDVKRYIHFDHPLQSHQIDVDVKDFFIVPGKISTHSFLPFIKIITKTPRYKFKKELNRYRLETKERPISYASHLDTFIYGFYSFVLNEKYQSLIRNREISDCVLAYRTDLSGKCNIQFAYEAFEDIKHRQCCSAIAIDIKGYFDSIDHKILKEKWCKVLDKEELDADEYAIYKSITKYSYVKYFSLLRHFNLKIKGKNIRRPPSLSNILKGRSLSEKLNRLRQADLIVKNQSHKITHDNKKRFYGIPQGSTLSALLSNIYLLDFDTEMFQLGLLNNFTYRRYCDDILIICNTSDAIAIQSDVIEKLDKQYHLTIQPSKVETIQFNKNSKGQIKAFNQNKINELSVDLNSKNEHLFYKNLQYLGFEYNGQKILLRNSSLSRYYRKLKIRINKSVGMAYGNSGVSDRVFKRQIFHRYSHLGKRNFLSYAYNASKKEYKVRRGIKQGMNSPTIRKQLSNHFRIIKSTLKKKTIKKFWFKIYNGKGRVRFKKA